MLGGSLQRTIALVFGIVFLLVGILGFIPPFSDGKLLLGFFAINAPHNIVHLLFGVLGIGAAFTSYARLYVQATGIIYLLIAILGFIPIPVINENSMLLGLVMTNMADNLLHLVIGIAALVLGFTPQFNRAVAASS